MTFAWTSSVDVSLQNPVGRQDFVFNDVQGHFGVLLWKFLQRGVHPALNSRGFDRILERNHATPQEEKRGEGENHGEPFACSSTDCLDEWPIQEAKIGFPLPGEKVEIGGSRACVIKS